MTNFVELDVARTSTGVRLVTVGGVPSPWSEAAKGIFRLIDIPFVAVRMMPGDKALREWTRSRNAPVVMHDDEPPRTGWADILELAERIAPKTARSLVPTTPADRVRMFGLAHETVGEGGLLWSSRLLTIDAGLETDGARGFPAPIAGYLAKRYGYTKERLGIARARIEESWALLAEALGGREYFFFDDRPSALDVYVASALNLFAPLPQDQCAMWPPIRAGIESMRGHVPEPPPAIVALRDRMYGRHLELPIVV